VYVRATDALAVVASAAVVLSTISTVRKILRIRALERSFWVNMDITCPRDGLFGYNAFVPKFPFNLGASPRLCSKNEGFSPFIFRRKERSQILPDNHLGEGPHPVASPPCIFTNFPAENSDSNHTSSAVPSRPPNLLLAISSMSSVRRPVLP